MKDETSKIEKFIPEPNGVTIYDEQGKWCGHMSLGGEYLKIKSAKRVYTFEYHHYFGPIPLRKDGEPLVRIPKDFWEAFQDWAESGGYVKGDLCVKSPETLDK